MLLKCEEVRTLISSCSSHRQNPSMIFISCVDNLFFWCSIYLPYVYISLLWLIQMLKLVLSFSDWNLTSIFNILVPTLLFFFQRYKFIFCRMLLGRQLNQTHTWELKFDLERKVHQKPQDFLVVEGVQMHIFLYPQMWFLSNFLCSILCSRYFH